MTGFTHHVLVKHGPEVFSVVALFAIILQLSKYQHLDDNSQKDTGEYRIHDLSKQNWAIYELLRHMKYVKDIYP